jgi:hypothetical protein
MKKGGLKLGSGLLGERVLGRWGRLDLVLVGFRFLVQAMFSN